MFDLMNVTPADNLPLFLYDDDFFFAVNLFICSWF